jgi:Ubiquitin-activating enzyme E1 FCCH domain
MNQISIVSKKNKTVGGQSITISGAANNGSGAIRLTATAHGLESGDIVQNSSVVGTVEANGQWVITVIDANHFDLTNSTFHSAYASGGASAHVGWSTAPDLSAPSWGSTPTNAALIFLLKSAPTGASLRFVFEDSAESTFASGMPAFTGSFSGGTGPSYDRRWDSRYQDGPDWRLQALNDFLRLKVLFPQGVAGQVFTFSSWLEY